MKCLNCSGLGYVPVTELLFPSGQLQCQICHGHGWIPFWTEAERVGIKAMGEEYLFTKQNLSWMEEARLEGIRDAIDAYVDAVIATRIPTLCRDLKKEATCEK